VLYGAVGANDADTQLYSIDPATGAGTPIGDIGNAVTGLAEDPTTGVLYGVTSNRANAPKMLITINKSTGAGTVVGPLGQIIADISFNSSGQLYGWAEGPDRLASIDKTTGAATPIGTTNYDTYGDGESFDKNDVLFDMSQGDQADGAFPSAGALWTVDTNTSVPTTVASLSGSPYPPGTEAAIGAASFACDRTTLYAVDNNFGSPPTYLIKVNTSTGAITTVGQTVTGLDALEWSCPQQIGFTTSATSVNQSAGTVTLTLTRTGGMKGAVSVNYSTADGAAKASTDYTAQSGTVTFANNQTTQTITVPIKSEGADATEAFTVNLSSPTAGASLGIASQTVTINGIPGATTGPAKSVGSSAATVTGSVTPNGVATTYHFDYGTSKQYGHSTTAKSAGSGTGAVAASARLTGLRPGAIYHYRVVAVSASGTTVGADRTFRTKAAISVSRVSRGLCTRASSALLRVRVTSLLSPRTTVRLDGKTIARGHRAVRVRVALSRLHAGRHTISVTTKSAAGTTTRTSRFTVCSRRTAPKFTG
jgi:hypothetical protein